jgi:DNA-binding MarR family transcriptional regulator
VLTADTHATATRWIALLEQRGLIAINADANDGRRKLVSLTDQGRTALSGALQQFVAGVEGLEPRCFV